MSKFLYLIPVILILISCSKEENPLDEEENNTATGFIRGNVENTSWFADERIQVGLRMRYRLINKRV